MTTIATDGKSMAGDGLCTGSGIVHGMSVRKVHRIGDKLVGMCGSVYNMTGFIEWLANGGDKPKLHDDFEALVLGPDGRCQTFDSECRSADQETPAVAGSGSPIALGAILAGATPEEAVRIAAARDTCTGGKITVEHIQGQGG